MWSFKKIIIIKTLHIANVQFKKLKFSSREQNLTELNLKHQMQKAYWFKDMIKNAFWMIVFKLH